MKLNIVFTVAKLLSIFNVKDSAPFIEKHNVIYSRSVCATESCNENYVGECARRLYEQHVKDHNGHNHSPRLVKHAGETDHLPIDTANFKIIGSRYCSNAHCRKIAEPLLVKKLKYPRK